MNYLVKNWQAARVLIVYRNVDAQKGRPASHVGLGVNALHTARVLRAAGIVCDIVGIWSPLQLCDLLMCSEKIPYSHVIIEAPWMGTADLAGMLADFPSTHFSVRCHSQIAFLQVEAGAVRLFREDITLQQSMLNFAVSANNRRFCRFAQETYGAAIAYLPNLYDYTRPRRIRAHRTQFAGGVVRIGSFGAIRLLKNHATAASAALMIASRLGAALEFHISTERIEHGRGVVDMLRNVFAGLPRAKLVEVPWMPWPAFRAYVGSMDLTLQSSFTETFNIVTADSIAEGVPAVVSSAIDWAPKRAIADVDDPDDIARAGIALLLDPTAAEEGIDALARHQVDAMAAWKAYLAGRRE